jgi:hypothetical protein
MENSKAHIIPFCRTVGWLVCCHHLYRIANISSTLRRWSNILCLRCLCGLHLLFIPTQTNHFYPCLNYIVKTAFRICTWVVRLNLGLANLSICDRLDYQSKFRRTWIHHDSTFILLVLWFYNLCFFIEPLISLKNPMLCFIIWKLLDIIFRGGWIGFQCFSI